MTNLSDRVESAVTKMEDSSDIAEKFSDAAANQPFLTKNGYVRPIGELQRFFESEINRLIADAEAAVSRIANFTEVVFSSGQTYTEDRIYFVHNGVAYTPLEKPFTSGINIQDDIDAGRLTIVQGVVESDLTGLVLSRELIITGGTVSRDIEGRLSDDLDVRDLGVKGDGITNDTQALNDLKTAKPEPFDGKWREYIADNLDALPYIKNAYILNNGNVHLPNITPESFGNHCSSSYYGGQLKRLSDKLSDPLCQYVGITFIGDSITWGVGATGTAPSGPRDQTLSDPRDFYKTNSYVNLVKREIKKMLGEGVSEIISNHNYSPSGESIIEYNKVLNITPSGFLFDVLKEGISSDSEDVISGALNNYRRALTVIPGDGNKVSLSFRFTGSEFDVVFGCIPNGAKYNVYINGKKLSNDAYSSREGDDGLTAGFSRSRTHSFSYVENALIKIEVIHYDNIDGNSALYLEAIRVNKVIKIKNNGLSGTTAKTYLTYSMPTTKDSGLNFKSTLEYPSFTAISNGTVSNSTRSFDGTITGTQSIFGFISNSYWEFDFSVDPTKNKLAIAFSSVDTTGDLQVIVNGTVIDSFSTSSNSSDSSYGVANVRVIDLPQTTESVKLKTVYSNYGVESGYTNYIYLEGLANYSDDDITYPVQNGFNDGLALDGLDSFCFLQLGTNNRIISSNKINTLSAMCSDIEKMISLSPDATNFILMCANNTNDFNSSTHHSGMSDVRFHLNNLAQRLNVDFIDNYSIFDGMPAELYTADNLHPNDLGHKLIASNISYAIKNAR